MPLTVADSPHMRKLLYAANSGYISPSRRTLSKKIDERAESAKEQLCEELLDDVKSHNTISITSDGGTSCDLHKTKKLTVTAHRIDDDFNLKTDTLSAGETIGTQEGVVIREHWEKVLFRNFKFNGKVNVTTDGAANMRNARNPGRHFHVDLNIKHHGDCVDHQIFLVHQDSLKDVEELQVAAKKVRTLCAHLNRSYLSRCEIRDIQVTNHMRFLSPIIGTPNR